jgi:hypothetical protein
VQVLHIASDDRRRGDRRGRLDRPRISIQSSITTLYSVGRSFLDLFARRVSSTVGHELKRRSSSSPGQHMFWGTNAFHAPVEPPEGLLVAILVSRAILRLDVSIVPN